jgi:hypothetical protein
MGENGGVVGLARDSGTGMPVPGVTIVPVDEDTSNAVVLYLNDDGSAFDAAATTTQGVFLIFSPGTGENFNAMLDGELVMDDDEVLEGTAGEADLSLFTLIMDVL